MRGIGERVHPSLLRRNIGDHLVDAFGETHAAKGNVSRRDSFRERHDVGLDAVALSANQCPVRPNPVMISSAMNSTSYLLQISRMRGK